MNLNRRTVSPLNVPRSNRGHEVRALTSMPSGKMTPLAAIPLLREDSVRRGQVQVAVEMQETAEILMNAVNLEVHAYLVPWLAFDRFGGSMDILNRSYEGQPSIAGGDVIPFYQVSGSGGLPASHWSPTGLFGENGIFRYLGLHARQGESINFAYREAYNQIWNHRVRNRSLDIDKASLSNNVLLPALWHHQAMQHVVPDFDQAVIDGEVSLRTVEFNAARADVKGIGTQFQAGSANSSPAGTSNFRETGATAPRSAQGWNSGTDSLFIEAAPGANPRHPAIYADLSALVDELNSTGITVSLADIDAARKTAAFARLRTKYEGIDEDWIINLLMDGITIPEQSLKYPILLSRQTAQFGMQKRYASDSGNLTESVVSGMAIANLNINLPRINTGGVIMIVAEVTPDQLWERKEDPLMKALVQPSLPNTDTPQYLRDTLDPEKVEIVKNSYVDVDHDTPDGTFGYAPLNHRWNVTGGRVGGDFYRPDVDTGFDEKRQRIWAVETKNPTLSEDFYLATQMHDKPFVVQSQDNFEVVTNGMFVINGNTVFGGVLVEASDNYDRIRDQIPAERIDKSE